MRDHEVGLGLVQGSCAATPRPLISRAIAPFDLSHDDTQLELIGGRTGLEWREGEKVTGARAVAIATTQLLSELPWGVLGSFPQGRPPEPPLVDESKTRSEQIRYVAGVYYRYLYERRGRAAPTPASRSAAARRSGSARRSRWLSACRSSRCRRPMRARK